VRELRQNLSVYLAKLADGVVFQVTDRGRPVAMLVPLPQATTAVERLIASGRATRPTRDFASLPPPVAFKGKMSLSEALREVREDR